MAKRKDQPVPAVDAAHAPPTDSCGDGAECSPETASGSSAGGQTAAATAAAPAQPSEFIYPFHVRYAAEYLQLTGFVDGQAYSAKDIRDLLIQNGYTEFADMAPAFHLSQATNTVVITIQGSTKGVLAGIFRGMVKRFSWALHGRGPQPPSILMPAMVLRQIEARFLDTYTQQGTEDRVLVYVDDAGNMGVVAPKWTRHRSFVAGDLPLALELDGRLWDLAFDLHSHHIMGAFWSDTDPANERIRGVVFGVCSWRDGLPAWQFRRWLGPAAGFESLPYSDVVTDSAIEVPMLEAGIDG